METLIKLLEYKRTSYESRFEPRAYNLEISGVIDCIRGNMIYEDRGKGSEDVVKEAKKMASFWTNISCSRIEKE